MKRNHPKLIQNSIWGCQECPKTVTLWYFNVLGYYSPHGPCIEQPGEIPVFLEFFALLLVIIDS